MSRRPGPAWLGWLIAGPTLWAVAFSASYGLHGLGCALGWPAIAIGPVSLDRAVILLVGLATLAACLALLARVKAHLGSEAALPRLGLWIGLGATAFTLAPVLVASTC
ncbi:hypothetical protein J5J86_21285 [Aquabacter sp. L1I39]|uniref:hypothetical protein n=1 Tax=Aquabacter sp. L1I39 TaxID=2820278 RepID=UPI001ADC5A1F|nr:hypothetical protein [Aquabacter sp. L1I39]QTL03252.1 hypothetical protein J5J86_21285 [Aquabacter sp. L1I39]